MKFNRKMTFLLGFGFFSTSMLWGIYYAFIPILLSRFLDSKNAIGWVMTIDNVCALTFIPIIGYLSDRTKTKYGRRKPYIMAALPVGAVLLSTLPFAASLPVLITLIIVMNIAMAINNGPVIALMPDITPKEHRSQANVIINFMGGIGAVLAYGAGSMLFGIDERLPFILCAVLMLFAVFMIIKFVHEPKEAYNSDKTGMQGLSKFSFVDVKELLPLLLAIFFWFVSYRGVESMFSLYGVEYLGVEANVASFSITFLYITFVAFAIPAGFVGGKIGKKRTIQIGIVGLLCVFGALIFMRSILMIRVFLAIGGVFWACININSYPIVVEKASFAKMGIFTGLYYIASQSAAIVSPPLIGAIIDHFGYGNLFIYACVAGVFAMVCMLFVKTNTSDSKKTLPSA